MWREREREGSVERERERGKCGEREREGSVEREREREGSVERERESTDKGKGSESEPVYIVSLPIYI